MPTRFRDYGRMPVFPAYPGPIGQALAVGPPPPLHIHPLPTLAVERIQVRAFDPGAPRLINPTAG